MLSQILEQSANFQHQDFMTTSALSHGLKLLAALSPYGRGSLNLTADGHPKPEKLAAMPICSVSEAARDITSFRC